MKIKYININSKIKYKIPGSIKNKKVGLVSTSQYLNQLKEIKKEFKNSLFCGQVLGCNASKAIKNKNKVDVFYFLGEGRFHPLEIARKTKKPVYISNGDKITKKEIQEYEKKQRGKLMQFYMAKTVAILVTTKKGQNRLKEAIKLKKQIKKPCYILIDNTFNLASLEDFNNIDIFINTACPRIDYKKVISLDLIQNAIKNNN